MRNTRFMFVGRLARAEAREEWEEVFGFPDLFSSVVVGVSWEVDRQIDALTRDDDVIPRF
jgi:hypothetical protein